MQEPSKPPSRSSRATPTQRPAANSSGGRTTKIEASALGNLSVTADESASRLIAVGETRLLDDLEDLIRELDIRHPQVLVETLILSLTETQERDFGIELQKQFSSGSAGVQLASLFGLGSPDPFSTIPAASGTGGSAVVLDPGEFSAVVRALESINEGRSLTIPKVLVNNNEDATLSSVVQTPYTSTNASSTVATTSFGGTIDAGTNVTVNPQIAAGDQLVLSYTVSLSSFVGEALDPTVPPPKQENRLQSTATVPDGHTVVLGGLEIETESEGETRVPILGSMPLISPLFRQQSRTNTKSRFYVFLKCSVMRDSTYEDLRYVSDRALAEAGLDDGWPELEPRVIK